MLSKLAPALVDAKLQTNAVLEGNTLIISYSDDSIQKIDLGPWMEAKLEAIKDVIARWDAHMVTQGTSMSMTYPASGKVGDSFVWNIVGGTPGATFTVSSNDAASGLDITQAISLDANGAYTGSSTPRKAGTFTVSFVFGAGAVSNKISVAENPSIPVVYDTVINYPKTAVQYKALTWTIRGGRPNSKVTVDMSPVGLNAEVTLDRYGNGNIVSVPIFYGEVDLLFTLYDGPLHGSTLTKHILVYPAADIVLSQYCSGYNLMRTLADGNGGQRDVLVEANNVGTCGFVNPIDTSGIPRNLYSNIVGGGSICALEFPLDGSWLTVEHTDTGGVVRRDGWWCPIDANTGERDPSAYEIYAKVVSLTSDGRPYVSSVYEQFCNTWINMAHGRIDTDHHVLDYYIDQSTWAQAGDLYSYGTNVIVYDMTIRKMSDQSVLTSFQITMTAARTCFAADTWFKTPSGDRMLATLKRGETVCSFSSPDLVDSSVIGWQTWTAPFEGTEIDANRESVIIDVQKFTANESIRINGFHTTMHHTHLVVHDGLYMWKKASDIVLGDAFLTIDKKLFPITEIEIINEPKDFVMLNVEDLDTLIVRADQVYILTHNES